jgi:hypothetical protein
MRETMPLLIKSNSAIVTRAMTPAQQQQGRLHIDNGNNTIIMRATIAIVTTAKTPAHQQQWRNCVKGNNASLMTSNKDDDASLTMVEMPAHQQQQHPHRDKSGNCHCNNSKDACTLMAMLPSQQGP